MKYLFLFAFIFFTSNIQSQEIIPQPIKLEKKKGQFLLSPTTVLLYTDAGEKATANFFNTY
ncbi:MAG: hypothetical protein ACOVNY_01625, partial [Chitinophagaceae bacterium]